MLNLKFKKIVYISISAIIASVISCNSNNNPSSTNSYIKCGGGLNIECPTGTYCKLQNDCGGLDKKGQCVIIPDSCPDNEDIICGCDDKEYKNSCIAETLGVTFKNSGTCIQAPSFK
jgi:hypothetical protein